MANSLLDLFTPQQPNEDDPRLGFSNSLVGLGMGLLSPYRPWAGESPFVNALQGYQVGAKSDQSAYTSARDYAFKKAQAAQSAANSARDFAFRQEQAKQAQSNFEREQTRLEQEPWQLKNMGDELDPNWVLFNPKNPNDIRPYTGRPPTAAPPFGSGGAVPYTGEGPLGTGGATAPPAPPAPPEPPEPPTTTSMATPPAVQPPAVQPPDAQPPAVRDEAFLQTLSPNRRGLVKAVAEGQIDPDKIDSKLRTSILTAAKKYRPDYNTADYQKRATPLPAEVAARMGLAKAFLDRTPALRQRIAAGELTDPLNKAQAYVGQGAPGELRRAIDEGSDAIVRSLTGAGMSIPEAQNYARRYQYDWKDTKDTAMRKLNELENALRYIITEEGQGHGGADFVQGYASQFGKSDLSVPQTAPEAPNQRTGGAAVPQQNWGRDANGRLVRIQ